MGREEIWNSLTHLIGFLAAVAGLVVLVIIAARQGDPWKIVSFCLYGASLALLYASSTLYHSLQGPIRKIFRRLDHYAIYLLIAGTYMPFVLVTLRGGWGWSLFGVIWGLAILGIGLELLLRKGPRVFSVVVYLAMGWLMLVAIYPLFQALSLKGLIGLFLGGLFYTVGVVFFSMEGRFRYAHSIWHLFVLLGSVSHYLVILFYVAK
ncbi:MAG: hemolysin III family protein [Deltaproteobacteria bacterium]|nr:hemolysin III family protein [Deltaproteobacteria bacterium]